MGRVIDSEERKKRIKMGIAVLLLSVPYVAWVSWASGTQRLPSPPVVGLIFVLNFVVAYLVLSIYRRHLINSKKGRDDKDSTPK